MSASPIQAPKRGLTPYISPAGAWALALGTSIGWGSLVVTSKSYLGQAGPLGSVLGLIIGAVVMLVVARNYHYMIECYPDAGGAYTYAKETFSPDHGFLAGWFLVLTYLAMFWANATSLPLFARYFLGDIFHFGKMYSIFGYEVYLGEVLLTMAAIALVCLLCARQRRVIMAIMIGLAAVLAIGITVCFLGSAAQMDGQGASFDPAFLPGKNAVGQVLLIACISPWAFIGFENISHASEEFTFSRTRTFRVLAAAAVSATLLYIFVILLSITAYPPEYENWLAYIRDLDALSGVKALPAFYAAQHYLGAFGLRLLMVCLLGLIVTSLIGNVVAVSRLLYAVARDGLLPKSFSDLNGQDIPSKAILLICCVSLIIPFLGRTAIGWIVDVTTIGAVIIYGIVSISTARMAKKRGDRLERVTGLTGLVLMAAFGVYLLAMNLVSPGSMAIETYILFTVWSILGILAFRLVLQRDKSGRLGHSVVVWIALLSLVLIISLIWMGERVMDTAGSALTDIHAYYAGESADMTLRPQAFMDSQIRQIQRTTMGSMIVVAGIFAVGLGVLLNNYSLMSRRARESEEELVNVKAKAGTDPLTGVKSKLAYAEAEQDFNARIEEGTADAFAVVVCDVNGLKHVNDTFGHKAGDEYIRSAGRLVCEIFAHSPVFRIGGDEFTAILTGQDYLSRMSLMEELHDRCVENIGRGLVVVSGGVSDYIPGTDANFHAVFERADALMYREKQLLKSIGAPSSPHR